MPALLQPATPFDGSLTLRAPCAGLVVFLHKPGAWIERDGFGVMATRRACQGHRQA